MSNIYADAINKALGVSDTSAPAPTQSTEPTRRTVVVATPKHDLGRTHAETYKGVFFVVREFGVVSFGCDPAPEQSYWTPFFTDEELVIENARIAENFEKRIANCRNGIERALANKPVWLGEWWKRPLTM